MLENWPIVYRTACIEHNYCTLLGGYEWDARAEWWYRPVYLLVSRVAIVLGKAQGEMRHRRRYISLFVSGPFITASRSVALPLNSLACGSPPEEPDTSAVPHKVVSGNRTPHPLSLVSSGRWSQERSHTVTQSKSTSGGRDSASGNLTSRKAVQVQMAVDGEVVAPVQETVQRGPPLVAFLCSIYLSYRRNRGAEGG